MPLLRWLLSFFFKKTEPPATTLIGTPLPEPDVIGASEVRKISTAGADLIKKFEGLRLESYLDDVGVPTIAWGHTGPEVRLGQKITMEEAERLFRQDVSSFESGVASLVKVQISQNQFDALVCFSYNVGLRRLEKSTLLKKLNAKDYSGAADQFLVWNKATDRTTGKIIVLSGLTKRRQEERALFLS